MSREDAEEEASILELVRWIFQDHERDVTAVNFRKRLKELGTSLNHGNPDLSSLSSLIQACQTLLHRSE